MNIQQVLINSFSGMCAGMWLDGLDGQEDELDDVSKGKLDRDPVGNVLIRPNRDAIAQQHADEDEEMIQEDLETRLPG
jgi:hypothetical protein